MRRILLLSLFLVLFSRRLNAQVTVSGSNGADGIYTSLTASNGAFAALNSNSQTGNAITVTITSDPSGEDGSNALTGASGMWSSLSIKPSGVRTVQASITARALITLSGVTNVTIDGLNAGGNTLRIYNSHASNYGTIQIINGASNNTIKNCTVWGSGNYVLYFSTGSTSGNNNNTIISNTISGFECRRFVFCDLLQRLCLAAKQ